MLLRPPSPITESIVYVVADGKTIRTWLIEKHDEFRDLVKARGFRWDWEVKVWWRSVDAVTGPAADRAAETAHVFLAAGFCVEVADDIAQTILDVSYEPEKRLRIQRAADANKVYGGWFLIIWPRDDDYWHAARRLPGNRYVKPHVVVPPEQYEAIIDFAERYGFWISPKAWKVINEAAARKRAALIIDVPPLPSAHPRPIQPEIIPGEIGIDPELVDDDEPV